VARHLVRLANALKLFSHHTYGDASFTPKAASTCASMKPLDILNFGSATSTC